jgi:DNA-binding beta-propeller fold protein YncE
MTLVIASALLLVIPIAGASGILAPNAGIWATPPSPLVASGTSCAVGTNPHSPTYDPVNHYIYVPNGGSHNLSILTGSCKLVKTVTFKTGSMPVAAAFNPSDNEVDVADHALNQVYAISGTKLTSTITSPTFDGPWGLAYDPACACMAVTNENKNTVSWFRGTSVISTFSVGTDPEDIAFVPSWGELLVANTASNNVTALPNRGMEFSFPVGTAPVGIASDPANGFDYGTNANSNNVTVIDGAAGAYSSISVGSGPREIAWDQAKLSMYVVNYASDNVSVIAAAGFPPSDTVTRTITGPTGAGLFGITYDDATEQVFVTGYSNGEVYIYD